jgi:hypothetical protein
LSVARCKKPNCRRKVHARDLCQKHYDESRKSKNSTAKKISPSVRKKPAAAKTPARAIPVKLKPQPLLGSGKPKSNKCCVAGCMNSHHARGYCKLHYGQLRRTGKVDASVSSTNRAGENDSGVAGVLSLEERLRLLKSRHELIKKEIENVHEVLASEDDVEIKEKEEEGEAEESEATGETASETKS